jgi:hypothetical protein
MPCSTSICWSGLVALATISLFVAGCGGSSGDVAKSGDLVVRVADSRQPSAGLAGATVTVTAGQANKTATTPADGVVTFRDLPAGSATVVVVRDLYRDFTSTGTVQGASGVGVTALMQRRTGDVNVTAVDAFAAPVPNVQVSVSVEGQTIVAVTDTTGDAVLAGVPTAAVSVQAAANGFLPEPALAVSVVESPTASLKFAMDRQTEPAGGIVTPPPTAPPPSPADNGQTLTFRIRAVVVDGQGQAIEDRQAADFTLVACADTDPGRAECVRSSAEPAFDAAYVPLSAMPEAFAKLPGQAAVPYAAALGYDQSGSISSSDPSDARVFASKGFLQTVGASDRVLLAAFAEGAAAKISNTPLTTYGTFTSDGVGYFGELDQFPALEGGGTPLYQALDAMLQYTAQNAPTVPGQRKAVVVFSDGFDTVCTNTASCRDNSIALSRTLGVDIFTIGLAGSVDTPTLAELAHRANGVHLVAANPEQLNALYGSLGALLQGSITTYETTWSIRAGTSSVFTSGRSVLGVMRVATGDTTLELPFLYTIP